MMQRGLMLSLLVCLVSLHAFSQQTKKKKDRFPSYFGLTAAPIFGSNFIGSKSTSFQDTALLSTTSFTQKTGFTFGASVRIGVTKLISIETGLYQVRRNFDVDMAYPDSSVFGTKRLSFVNYDIPINALFYVQLSERWYMNAALGLSIVHYPSDVRDSILPGGKYLLQMEGRRVERTHFASGAGIGFEFRTKKAGTFYFGGSAKIPFRPIFLGVGFVKKSGSANDIISVGRVNGSYFSIEARYYLPTLKQKGEQFKPGPIEQ